MALAFRKFFWYYNIYNYLRYSIIIPTLTVANEPLLTMSSLFASLRQASKHSAALRIASIPDCIPLSGFSLIQLLFSEQHSA